LTNAAKEEHGVRIMIITYKNVKRGNNPRRGVLSPDVFAWQNHFNAVVSALCFGDRIMEMRREEKNIKVENNKNSDLELSYLCTS
jgi:hypothetical protein